MVSAISLISGLFKVLTTIDPSLLIVDNKGASLRCSDLPPTLSAFQDRLSFFVNKPPSTHATAEVVCSLNSALAYHDVKKHKTISHFLTNKNVFLESNPLSVAKITRLGFCRSLCPDHTLRSDLREHILELLSEHMTTDNKTEFYNRLGTHQIDVLVRSNDIFYGSEQRRVHTRALELVGPLAVSDLLRQTMMELSLDDNHSWFRFIPSTLGREQSHLYERQLRIQNQFLSELRIITVYGLFPAALDAPVTAKAEDYEELDADYTSSLKTWFYEGNHIDSIEPTNKSASEGKYFLLPTLPVTTLLVVTSTRSPLCSVIAKPFQAALMSFILLAPP